MDCKLERYKDKKLEKRDKQNYISDKIYIKEKIMSRPTLVIMAAGMGSRYGGLKQMDKITKQGELIIDFSLYDAYMAGFQDVVIVIKKDMEEDFRAIMKNRADKHLNIQYVFQDIQDIPEGYKVPEGREKPWGTSHAVLSARNVVKGAFAVINADDYYGPMAFEKIFEYLGRRKKKDEKVYDFCMVSYPIENTLTENGDVSRGVCTVDDEDNLEEIVERTKIKWIDAELRKENDDLKESDEIAFCQEEDNKLKWNKIDRGTRVSMNFWGFTNDMMKEMEAEFPEILDDIIKNNPLKGEFFLPFSVDKLIKSKKAKVKVLDSKDRWYGVTYKEDKEEVVNALQSLKDKGLYPEVLWK